MNQNSNINILNEYMANLKVLNNNLYNMHFNIVGESFFGLHRKLQEYYEKVALMYDAAAERIKMLGGMPITSLKEIEEVSTMKSMKSMNFTGKQVLEVLDNDFSFLRDYTKDLIEYYEKEKDYYTISMLEDNLNYIEKQLWMIKTSLI
jgi:starvation-inducible DNA-binding protein